MNIYYFIATLAGTSTVIIWLGKFIITKTVDVGIEKYKAELSKDIDKHKAELSKITLEHQIKFSKLHEERATKIKLLYDKVREMEKSLNNSTTRIQGPEFGTDVERDKKSQDLIFELEELIDIERIYFSESTISKFELIILESKEILKDIRDVRYAYSEYDRFCKTNTNIPEKILEKMKEWSIVEKRVGSEFKELKQGLANEFRTLLGISI